MGFRHPVRQSTTQSWLPPVRSILLAVLGAEVAVLVVTGIALYFLYRPTAGQAWGDLVAESYDDWDVRIALALRALHRLASGLAVLTAVALGILIALRPAADRRRVGPALGGGMAVTALLASFTGFLLPWDQLALSAVTVGSNLRGYTALFDPVVRFVLIGGVEVSPGTILLWLFIHALVLGPLLIGLLVLAYRGQPSTARFRATRRSRQNPSTNDTTSPRPSGRAR